MIRSLGRSCPKDRAIPDMKARLQLLLVLLSVAAPKSVAEIVPKSLLEGLASEDYSVREHTQEEILEWARQNPEARAGSIVALSTAEDPEIRKRSEEVIRKLSDDDYLSDGQGYLGINMLEETLKAGPDGKPGVGIRILNVMRDSPSHVAGIKAGDLIIALDGKKWQDEGAVNAFMETIAKKKPLANVVLTIRRDAADPVEIAVKLGKRPIPDLRAARQDIGLLDKQAKEEHFREWLKRQKLDQD